MNDSLTGTRRIFQTAWIWGVVTLTPMFFLEPQVNQASGRAITHPEYYYAFIALALVFQAIFFLLARDPLRYRPLMLVSIFEKAAFAVPAAVLVALGRADPGILFFAATDAILGAAFAWAFFRTHDPGGATQPAMRSMQGIRT